MSYKKSFVALALMLCAQVSFADPIAQTKGKFEDKFRQLDESLPTPNIYRNAAGEPGQQYLRILIYVNTDSGQYEHPAFPALGSVLF